VAVVVELIGLTVVIVEEVVFEVVVVVEVWEVVAVVLPPQPVTRRITTMINARGISAFFIMAPFIILLSLFVAQIKDVKQEMIGHYGRSLIL